MNIRLANRLIMDLAELLKILKEVINLQIVLLREERYERIHPINLPIIFKPLNKLLYKELTALLDDLLGRQEGHDRIALSGDFSILL